MKIIVTGSLGYVGKPVTEQLVAKGHAVTVITSNAAKQKDIEALGAKAAIGSMDDADFLTQTFAGADAVYCMLAITGDFADPANTVHTIIETAGKVANNYVQAIEQSGVKHVVYLSTVGADMIKGSGLLIMHHNAENTLNKLPAHISISFMRPVGFYKNLFAQISAIKTRGVIASNYGGDDCAIIVAAEDIASAIVEELESTTPGRKVRYIASEELTCNEVASILGEAIGKPDLQWITISNEQLLGGMKAFMNESIAKSFVEMNASIHNGKIYEDYNKHKPVLGKVKLKEFAKEFAAVYNNQ
ncbi:NmrA family NAD(P)-binding protein [Mucilaginibacter sp.]